MEKNWLAAVIHLSELIDARPDRADFHYRRGYAYSELDVDGAAQGDHQERIVADHDKAVDLIGEGQPGLLLTGQGEHIVAPHVAFGVHAETVSGAINLQLKRLAISMPRTTAMLPLAISSRA